MTSDETPAVEPVETPAVEPVETPAVEPVETPAIEPVETPLLRVITPDTTPEEVAAIVAVLSAMGGGPAPEPPRSEWANPARAARMTPGTTFPHGKGAWRASGLPR